ncbi:MAG: sigma-54-dependent Fis family transcriptional regulator [Thermogutta sp.]|nr:sigma-54-dependent Fis family transcriptional regulator [Thermogutta sp.]
MKRKQALATEADGRGTVLVVDDHAAARASVADVLRRCGYVVRECSSGAEALQAVERSDFDCIITDMKMPGMSGLELIGHLERRRLRARVIMVTAYASVSSAVAAMRMGAFDYIEKPFDLEQLEKLTAEAVRHARLLLEGNEKQDGESAAAEPPVMIGSSRPMIELRAKIEQVAATSETVLITGESGTGKELVARWIHATGPRRRGPFVSVNCPALAPHLMESELFGHERGAYTGADSARAGRFETADGGTLLLDEVTEIGPPLQAKLLRVLQEKAFERVGSSETRCADVRVIAATNRDLSREVAAGAFRADLYYRLAVLPIDVPPLRERREDIPELIAYFRSRCQERLGREVPEIDRSALEVLAGHDWPGNVRELENLVTRLCVLENTPRISADRLRKWLPAESQPRPGGLPEIPVGTTIPDMERQLIEKTLEQFGGHRSKAAKALGIGVRTLTDRLRQYGYAPRTKEFRKAG